MKKMNLPRYNTLLYTTFFCVIVAITSCSNEPKDVLVTGVSLSHTTFSLVEGAEAILIATVTPDDASNKTVIWTSSNVGVAMVDNSGKVTAVTAGETIITVTTEDGGQTDECTVTVTALVDVTGVTLNVADTTLSPIETLSLIPAVLPANASNKTVIWTSSDETVATVSDGEVIPVADGTVTITVTTEEGKKTDSCIITVNLIGTVSFKTTQTWTVGAQTWSDVVMATGCKKSDFNGGHYNSDTDYDFRVDCRQNVKDYGDLFSWEAVKQFGEQLCPPGWRVPTATDYCNLDKELNNRTDCSMREEKELFDPYMGTEWGGRLEGAAMGANIFYTDQRMFYWTNTRAYGGYCVSMFAIKNTYLVSPNAISFAYMGMSVRCVK